MELQDLRNAEGNCQSQGMWNFTEKGTQAPGKAKMVTSEVATDVRAFRTKELDAESLVWVGSSWPREGGLELRDEGCILRYATLCD